MNNLEIAFKTGYEKRAEELGFSKQAFLPLVGPIAGTALRIGGGLVGSVALPGLVSRLAVRGGLMGRKAKQLATLMNAPGSKGMIANMGLMQVGGMAGDAVVSPFANKLDQPA